MYDDLMALVERAARGRFVLHTPRGAAFMVGIDRHHPVFIPQSTGVGRTAGRKAAERFLHHYNATGSVKPGDYRGLTRDASYFIALILASQVATPDNAATDGDRQATSETPSYKLEARLAVRPIAAAAIGLSLLVLLLVLGRLIRRWLARR